jgi:stearoyl-CoA 9-desaturase NADPH oxidoreductase
MAERGAVPNVPPVHRRALGLIRSFTSPLLPDDYLELVNPLWSTRELRGRVESVRRASSDAVTVTIKPGWEWPGHQPGQYLRLGIEVDGVHHWRAYSLTSEPLRADGCIAITPKLVPDGKVSPHLCERLRAGTIVRLGGVEGTFTLPSPLPERLLFVSAGSGITPIASMLRSLAARGELREVVHVHSSHTEEQIAFAHELKTLQTRYSGYELNMWISGERGRVNPERLSELCPDWTERETFLCGPPELLHELSEHWRAQGEVERLHVEHFQPEERVGDGERGEGGTIRFCKSEVEGVSDGEQPMLVAGENAGAKLPYGCRMGICHSCVGRLRSGKVRDLRTGAVHGQAGELMRTCVNAPEGPVEIDL